MRKSQAVNLYLRLTLLGFTTITLGLIGSIHAYHYFKFARVNLGISACVITMVFGILCGICIPFMDAGALNDGLGMVIFDFMDMGLMLATAATLSNRNNMCHTIVDDPVKGPRPGEIGYCGLYRASIAFFWLTWIVSTVCFAFSCFVWYNCTYGDKSWSSYVKPAARKSFVNRSAAAAPPLGGDESITADVEAGVDGTESISEPEK